MSFSKCSNLETKTRYTSKFAIKEIKGRTITSDKQNLVNKAFKMAFTHLKIKINENFKLKKITKTKM